MQPDGPQVFQNSLAPTWVAGVAGAENLQPVLLSLQKVSTWPDTSKVPMYEALEGWMAAEVVAAVKGKSARGFPMELREWSKKRGSALSSDVLESALDSVKRIQQDSELKDFWEKHAEDGAMWKRNIQELRVRLVPLGGKPPPLAPDAPPDIPALRQKPKIASLEKLPVSTLVTLVSLLYCGVTLIAVMGTWDLIQVVEQNSSYLDEAPLWWIHLASKTRFALDAGDPLVRFLREQDIHLIHRISLVVYSVLLGGAIAMYWRLPWSRYLYLIFWTLMSIANVYIMYIIWEFHRELMVSLMISLTLLAKFLDVSVAMEFEGTAAIED